MTVRRIVANIATRDIAAAKRFYHDVLGLDILMDQGWIATYGSEERMQAQVSFMAEGGQVRRCRTFRSRSTMWMRRLRV